MDATFLPMQRNCICLMYQMAHSSIKVLSFFSQWRYKVLALSAVVKSLAFAMTSEINPIILGLTLNGL